MPEKETTNFKLPYPTGVGKVSLGAKDFEELAKKTDEVLGEKILIFKSYAGPATLKSGELAWQTKSGETFTLPAVGTANQIIGVFCDNGASSAKVTTSGGASIYGDFILGLATITLLPNQHVILQSNGSNWFIVSGEPKRTAVYTEPEAERLMGTEYEPSATREAQVMVTAVVKPGAGFEIFVGGVKIALPSVGAISDYIVPVVTFMCPAGVKWKCVKIGNAEGLKSTYLLR